jgi:hypothetical protein
MDDMLARELIAETNRMHTALTLYETDRNLGRDSDDQLVQCAAAGCSLLRNNSYMQAMVIDAGTLTQRAREQRSTVEGIIETDHFDFFLEGEKRLLTAAGADSSLVEVIIQQCRDAREKAGRDEVNTNQFRDALEELRDAVCTALAELRGSSFSQSPRRTLQRRLTACFEGVCGGVIVGLDATALAVSIGLSAAGSAVSGALGAAIVGDAIANLRAAGSAGTATASV